MSFVSERRVFKEAPVGAANVIEALIYGFFAGFEIRFAEPLPNADASKGPWRIILSVIGPNGERPDFQFIGEYRDVATADEARR